MLDGFLPFVHQVPYRLHLPPLPGGAVPLLVALHGKGDSLDRFEAEALEAVPDEWGLLVPSAPLPRDSRTGREGGIGHSWYLYDGDTPEFRASLGRAETFLVDLVTRVRMRAWDHMVEGRPVDPKRMALLGFSQGAYLAGVTAMRHSGLFGAAVLAGGRLKSEMLEPWFGEAKGLRILGIHGRDDRSVGADPCRRSIEAASAAGLPAEFREMDGGHEFTPAMRAAAREWLAGVFG